MTQNSDKLDRHLKEDSFFRLFSANQNEVFSYIVALVPNSVDAEDIFQETCAVMWRKFDDFVTGTDFAAWSCKIAWYIVLEHRRKTSKNFIRYSTETLNLLAESYSHFQKESKQRIESLNDCLKNLSDKERFLIQQRYNNSLPVKMLAEQMSVSISMIYKLLSKIHFFLLECVQRATMSGELK